MDILGFYSKRAIKQTRQRERELDALEYISHSDRVYFVKMSKQVADEALGFGRMMGPVGLTLARSHDSPAMLELTITRY